MAGVIDHPAIHADGFFLGISEEEYAGALALSASGIKWLRASPLDWWVRCPVLNPEYRDEDTTAKAIGRAYHRRIVEGRDVFLRHYCRALSPSDYPTALRSNDDLTLAIIQAGGPKPKSSYRKAELIDMLLSFNPDAVIWQHIEAEYLRRNEGKTPLPPDVFDRVEKSAAMIESHPDLSRAFQDGYPECAVFWREEVTGVPLKAKIDFLKPHAIVDLKSYENVWGLPTRRAIARALAAYRYHIQCALYIEAAKQIDGVERTFMFVWQSKGLAPVATGAVLGPGTVLDIARMEIRQAIDTWAQCWAHYGADPWVAPGEIYTIDDTELPAYISE